MVLLTKTSNRKGSKLELCSTPDGVLDFEQNLQRLNKNKGKNRWLVL